ncbi:MAG: 1-deoxy-D-xylulose-5-phosphate reductoisomerase [Puniceicoccales bacterium]|jgi:1-deoxy-D-xylulose-5-phosphate reductoisomerase|nr:1-deoxy-D-xylulose-5-phosphate reductoisomerase [Puniceicoccales bacterium]
MAANGPRNFSKNLRNVVLLGATGSVGRSTLQVLRSQPNDFRLIAISAHSNHALAESIQKEFSVRHLSLADDASTPSPSQLAADDGADLVVLALPGMAALRPLLAAIEAGKTIVLASKEVVAAAGNCITLALRQHPTARILPVDSEHCAIFQCLAAPGMGVFHPFPSVRRIWLTASGGPFWDLPAEKFCQITVEQALRHPSWSMGPKVSIDAATMANKGLEEMEAAHFFQLRPDQICVTVHPGSRVHALVEFFGGFTTAALHLPSMEIPIAHCLNHPNLPLVDREGIDFSTPLRLEFFPPDRDRFPCLALAENALRLGRSAPCDFDAANAEAVQAFLLQKISFGQIPISIARTLDALDPVDLTSVDAVEERHDEVRQLLRQMLGRQGCAP